MCIRDRFPSLQGLYIFADTISNEFVYTDAANPGSIVFSDSFNGNAFVSFGVDQNNELYTAALGSGSIFRIVDLAALSIDGASLSLATVFPNPAHGEVVFEYPAFAKAEHLNIYNLNGKLVQSEFIQSATTTFSVAQLSAGMYMARLEGNSQTIKLVVQ